MPPPKPWESANVSAGGAPSAVSPLGSSTATDGTVKPWDNPSATGAAYTGTDTRTLAARPWERGGVTQNGYASTSYSGGYNSGGMFGSGGYGSGGYGSSMYGGAGMYGSGGYGSSMYSPTSMYGGSMTHRPGMYGSSMYGGGGGMYGSNMYGGGLGGGMYGGGAMYGGGGMFGGRPMLPGPDGQAGPPRPPAAWEALLTGFHAAVALFGRIAALVDENTFAVHVFIDALLRLLDRAGALYGELARFVLRLLGWKGPARGKPAMDEPRVQTPSDQGSCTPAPCTPATPGAPRVPTGRPRGMPGMPAGFDSAWGGGGRGAPAELECAWGTGDS